MRRAICKARRAPDLFIRIRKSWPVFLNVLTKSRDALIVFDLSWVAQQVEIILVAASMETINEHMEQDLQGVLWCLARLGAPKEAKPALNAKNVETTKPIKDISHVSARVS